MKNPAWASWPVAAALLAACPPAWADSVKLKNHITVRGIVGPSEEGVLEVQVGPEGYAYYSDSDIVKITTESARENDALRRRWERKAAAEKAAEDEACRARFPSMNREGCLSALADEKRQEDKFWTELAVRQAEQLRARPPAVYTVPPLIFPDLLPIRSVHLHHPRYFRYPYPVHFRQAYPKRR